MRLGKRPLRRVMAIAPRQLIRLIGDADRARARRAFEAMMQMKRIDIVALERAADGIPTPSIVERKEASANGQTVFCAASRSWSLIKPGCTPAFLAMINIARCERSDAILSERGLFRTPAPATDQRADRLRLRARPTGGPARH